MNFDKKQVVFVVLKILVTFQNPFKTAIFSFHFFNGVF